MKKQVIRCFAMLLTVAMMAVMMVSVNASAGNVEPQKVSLPSATPASAKMDLSQLIAEMHRVYLLSTYVSLLQEANSFGGFSNGLMRTSDEYPVSIYAQFSEQEQQMLSRHSVYWGYRYAMESTLYAENENFRKQVDSYYNSFMNYLPTRVRECLADFLPAAIIQDLSPDELEDIGDAICYTDAYQKLQEAMRPVSFIRGIYSPLPSAEDLGRYFSASDLELLRYNILSAAGRIWPEYLDYLPATISRGQ